MSARVLVTAALPYANGPIHLGHLLEAVQTDVYVRARRLDGDDVIFMWADDTHGTPIQLRARAEGISPEALIARAYEQHVADYRAFGIGFDIYYTTHSEENRRHAGAMFQALEARGDIAARTVEQLYCTTDAMFLPDRFVKGKCPRCKAPDQYGDNCEVCGGTHAPTELGDPYCSICGNPPVLKGSEHLFVPLARHELFLRQWLRPAEEGGRTALQPSVRNYVLSWIDSGLRDWDISRDGPYFGFEIPGHPGKYFYVWFDAPVGYIAATQKYCDDRGLDFDRYWRNPGGDTEIVHVIGKDIVYFHCLFWPAMLHASGYTTPSRVQVHGWLTVNGEKMSKTRGTFILASKYLEFASPDYLRYYLAAKLGPNQDDLDLSIEDFVNRVNADLVNKAANLASRCGKFLNARLDGVVAALSEDAATLVERARGRLGEAARLYREFDSARATRLALEIAEEFNVYVADRAPWKMVAEDPERARQVVSAGLWASQVVATILKPVLPGWAETVERFLKLSAPLRFANGADPLPAGHRIGPYENLAQPLDIVRMEALIEASKENLMSTPSPAPGAGATPAAGSAAEPLAAETTIDDFARIDLRVGRVSDCSRVEGADKLLRLTVDLGPLGQRTIFSGIAKSYAPERLVGKHVAVYANLKPRKMRFGLSEGMILAAGAGDDQVVVVELDPRSKPGDRIG
jgi:methionyl-tRNA synthetase